MRNTKASIRNRYNITFYLYNYPNMETVEITMNHQQQDKVQCREYNSAAEHDSYKHESYASKATNGKPC